MVRAAYCARDLAVSLARQDGPWQFREKRSFSTRGPFGRCRSESECVARSGPPARTSPSSRISPPESGTGDARVDAAEDQIGAEISVVARIVGKYRPVSRNSTSARTKRQRRREAARARGSSVSVRCDQRP